VISLKAELVSYEEAEANTFIVVKDASVGAI